MQKWKDRSLFPHTSPSSRPVVHMVTSLGNTSSTLESSWLSGGRSRAFLYVSPLFSVSDNLAVLMFPPRIRWEGMVSCEYNCFLQCNPQNEPGKSEEHCPSTGMECLTGWVMVTVWEQETTCVDQDLCCPS